jgi:hypothetical protein
VLEGWGNLRSGGERGLGEARQLSLDMVLSSSPQHVTLYQRNLQNTKSTKNLIWQLFDFREENPSTSGYSCVQSAIQIGLTYSKVIME